MGNSPNYQRIKRDVLALTNEIPKGRVATYAVIADELQVMPRHVAYILATLDSVDAESTPWHRVVGANGLLKSTKRRSADAQAELLRAEGVTIAPANRVVEIDELLYRFE